MKVAIAYSTKNRAELSRQSFPILANGQHALFWYDGSTDPEALEFFKVNRGICTGGAENVKGGADFAIVFALTNLLAEGYDIVGLCENDVLLAPDWFERTIHLFERGAEDGLVVGAVSPRCYEDRVLIQRDGYAVMHNLGAGIVLFTREAARIVLDNYRTGWWHDNRAIFTQLSGIDIGRYAAFRGNEQWTSCDWHWDAVLAQHGLASLALTPSMVDMIGQEPSLEEQGLTLATGPVEERRDDLAFARFCARTTSIRDGTWKPDAIMPIHEHAGTQTIFAHQLPFPRWHGEWRLKWSQGFGGFAWRAAEPECVLKQMLFGPATFLVSGGKHGAKVTITDSESGYEIKPEIPAGEQQIAQLQVPGGMSYREIVLTCSAGAIFYGVQTSEPQPVTNRKFNFHSLPPV